MTTAVMNELDWQAQAKCAGMDRALFFPEASWMIEPLVRSTCSLCAVRGECLTWALEHDEQGVWGGLSDEERAKISKTQSRVRCPDCRSTQVQEQDRFEICLSCGLSWSI